VNADAVAIVVAAGSGSRLGADAPKAFLPLGGQPMLVRAVRGAFASGTVRFVVVAAPRGHEDLAHRLIEPAGPHAIVTGGDSRHASVRAALAAVPADADVVVVHDAARPFASPRVFAAVIDAIAGADGAVPVLSLVDTVKRVRDGWIVSTETRDALAATQTPQAFRLAALRTAHDRAFAEGLDFTDDAAVLEWAGFRVRAVEGEAGNFKITTGADLERAIAVAGRARSG
jgi:2-C-methyl-D-erythritol 4-phosphate cytidylyltransferase / 2-C-methyl-D-erythritol 2,4-cyclodiphosphate synthase